MTTYATDLDNSVANNSNFMVKVYNWMFLALALTTGTAFYTAMNPSLLMLVATFSTLIIIMEIALVIFLSWFISKISTPIAFLMFILYSILNGLLFSFILVVYSMPAIILAFGVTAGTFLFMSVYGYFTKSDLSSFGTVMIVGLFGLILGSFVNWFLHSSSFDYLLTWVGVIIFTGLTAYDTQKIKAIGDDGQGKNAIIGALSLYLDFINLFLYILKLFGGSRK